MAVNEARLRSAKILAVDDDVSSTCLLVNFLTRFGYNNVRTVSDSAEVLSAITDFAPDIVLLDLRMPGLDGFEIMRQLKEGSSPEDAIPVLVVSSDVSRETKRKALAGGATDILGKPFDPSEMLMRIRNLLSARFLRLELQCQNRGLEDQVSERTRELEKALADLKQSQQQAIQHERLRAFGEMAGGVVHDFNNALMSVIGYSELLLDEPAMLDDKPVALEYIQIMNSAGREASNVVGRLRDFYRQRSDDDVLWSADLNKILTEVVEITKPKWKDQALADSRTIMVDLDLEKVPQIHCNARELREVATNLIFNAVDAMPNGGTITVRTRRETDRVLWEIVDTGIGMSEEIRARCLEPFFSTKGSEGSGLGLSIVFGAIKRHDGEIDIESEVGRGSTFRIRLPVPTTEREPVENTTNPGKSLRVLVADDDRLGRDVIAQYLRVDGHSVVTASNGLEALDLFKAKKFDLLVADYGMPGMSGVQLARAVKQTESLFPVILVTGFTEAPGILEKSKDLDAVLSKPLPRNALRRAVADLALPRSPKPPDPDVETPAAA